MDMAVPHNKPLVAIAFDACMGVLYDQFFKMDILAFLHVKHLPVSCAADDKGRVLRPEFAEIVCARVGAWMGQDDCSRTRITQCAVQIVVIRGLPGSGIGSWIQIKGVSV